MPLAKALKKSKRGILSRWKRQIVVNSMQARLRAQLGDRSEYSGERRRRSVVVASIVLTITDPLRGSYPFGTISKLRSFAPAELHSLAWS